MSDDPDLKRSRSVVLTPREQGEWLSIVGWRYDEHADVSSDEFASLVRIVLFMRNELTAMAQRVAELEAKS